MLTETKLEPWQHVWRNGFVPNLPTDGLLRLRVALATDDERLQQGATCYPPPLQVVEDWPLESCDCVVWCFCVPGENKVKEASEAFARSCFEADRLMGTSAGCRHFLNWYDDAPRGKMRHQLLREVDLALFNRLEIPLLPETPPGIVADWLTERGREEAEYWPMEFKE